MFQIHGPTAQVSWAVPPFPTGSPHRPGSCRLELNPKSWTLTLESGSLNPEILVRQAHLQGLLVARTVGPVENYCQTLNPKPWNQEPGTPEPKILVRQAHLQGPR